MRVLNTFYWIKICKSHELYNREKIKDANLNNDEFLIKTLVIKVFLQYITCD